MEKLFKVFVITALAGLLAACEALSWYSQAAVGQIKLLYRSQDVDQVLKAETTPEPLKKQLLLSREILAFAKDELSLPVGDNYSAFIELDRDYPVWNVYAAESLSIAPYQWCYLIVGCVSYRGYFSEQDAINKADELKEQGLEVFVHGVAAYSTLGWFDDPLMSSFIYRSEMELTRLLFHELVHKLLYIDDDTLFNESFAEAVAEEGLRRWYEKKQNQQAYQHYQQTEKRKQAFNDLLLGYRAQLQFLFANENLSVEDKQQKKTQIYQALKNDYQQFRQQWQYQGYDRWMQNDLNNAKLAIVGDYHSLVPAFRESLKAYEGKKLDDYYDWIKDIAEQEPRQRLEALKTKNRG